MVSFGALPSFPSTLRRVQDLLTLLGSQGALIDSGARQLIGIFTKWVKETSPSMDAGKLYDQGACRCSCKPLHRYEEG